MGRLVCSCGKVLDSDYPVRGDSHGVCMVCEVALKAEIAERKARRLRELRMES